MEKLQETDFVNLVWDVQLLRYHAGAHNLNKLGLANVRKPPAVGALVFLLWDIVITWGDEVQYIWP